MRVQKLDSKIYQFIKNSCIAVLVMGAAILFYACEDNIDQIKAFSSPENLPVQEAIDFETLSTDSGLIRNLMRAPLLLQFENEGKSFYEFPKGIEILKYDVNKVVVSSIRADYAKQFPKEGKWEAKNNVVLTNAAGDSLKTEHLILEEKSQKIYTDEFVKIIREDQVITGVGLVSNQDMSNWKIKNPKGTLYISVDNKTKPGTSTENSNVPSIQTPDKKEAPKPIQFK
jgi:LPS export ABC transporter protein LptC